MHDSDNFQKLKWLPINQMFKINKLDLLKKVIDGRAPEYLQAWTQFGLSTSILQEQKKIIPLTDTPNWSKEENILLFLHKRIQCS